MSAKKPIGLIYTGKRWNGDEIVHSFLTTDTKEEKVFTIKRGSPRVWIAHTYKAERFDENGQSRVTLYYTELDTQATVSDEDESTWRAKTYAAEEEEKRFKFSQRLDKNPFPDDIVKGLARYCKNLTFAETLRAMDRLAREIHQEVKRSKS